MVRISPTKNIIQSAATAMLAACSFAGVIYLQLNLLENRDNLDSQPDHFRQEELEKAQINTLAQSPTFGFSNLVADWAYYRFLQYFGDTPVRQETGYSVLPDYLEVIAKKDPQFIEAFRLLAPVSSIYAGRPEITVHWLETALEQLSPEETPLSYLVWVHKAHDELLMLGDAAAASHSYKMAADWASVSDDPNAQRSADNFRRTAQFLKENPISPIPRIASWAMILTYSQDQDVQEIAIQKIEELGGKVNVDSDGRVQLELPE